MNLTSRPATRSDRAFVESTYFETQRWLIEKLFGWRGDEFERGRFFEHYHEADTSIVVVDGHDAGWICVRQGSEALHLHSIYLLPALQNRGLGTTLIQRVLDDAASRSLKVTLGTAKINPALRLYERLGFARTGEDDRKFYLEWHATIARSGTSTPARDC